MTLPTLIGNYQKKVVVTQLKTVYSILSQAITNAQYDYGDMSGWDFVYGVDGSTEEGQEILNASLENFAHKYIFPYVKIITDCGADTSRYCNYPMIMGWGIYEDQWSSNDYRFIINNSMLIRLVYGNSNGMYGSGIWMFVDLNNRQGPNRPGRDIFTFYLDYKTSVFAPYGRGHSREELMNGSRGCNLASSNGTKGGWCAALIEYDGWEIKKDYPAW